MQEENFWVLLSVLIIVLSVICVLLVGFIYFNVVPRPVISRSTPFVRFTSTLHFLVTITQSEAEVNIPTSTPFPTRTPGKTTETPTLTERVPGDQVSPEEFIRTYYSLINQRQYNSTFAMLSNGFKDERHCCNPDGSYQIGPYINWWDTMSEVSVLSVDTRRWEDTSAQVVIQIRYYKKDGNVIDNTHTFNLKSNSSGKSWLIQ